MTIRRSRRIRRRDLAGLVAAGLVGVALVKEMRTPAPERSWHGTLFGVVPYDFRRPTWQRLRASWWAPDSRRLLLPRAFGVGWSLNLARFRRSDHDTGDRIRSQQQASRDGGQP